MINQKPVEMDRKDERVTLEHRKEQEKRKTNLGKKVFELDPTTYEASVRVVSGCGAL